MTANVRRRLSSATDMDRAGITDEFGQPGRAAGVAASAAALAGGDLLAHLAARAAATCGDMRQVRGCLRGE